jgi:hypothetical protein
MSCNSHFGRIDPCLRIYASTRAASNTRSEFCVWSSTDDARRDNATAKQDASVKTTEERERIRNEPPQGMLVRARGGGVILPEEPARPEVLVGQGRVASLLLTLLPGMIHGIQCEI